MADIYLRSAQDNLSLQELTLYHEIMEYRAESGLAPVKLSKALTTTAARHVIDTRENILAEDGIPANQNLHTWSTAPYFSDGSNPEAMWEAPQRLGTGYLDPGYEISAAGQRDVFEALEGWQNSPPHDRVILNQGPWSTIEYGAIGIGVDTSAADDPYLGRVFHVWFGEDPDPTGVPRIVGTGGADRIRATVFEDNIVGLGGDDRIGGGGGGDALWGGLGRDALAGGSGHDRLHGGGGADHLSGGSGRDALTGSSGHDRLHGGGGADRLSGGSGNDRLAGGSGADTLIGNGGRDALSGGRGKDTMTGGADADVFVFRSRADAGLGAARDVIADFRPGLDRIDLSALDGDLLRAGNQGFDFIGGAGLSGTPGELNYRKGVLSADVNGDLRADFQIDIGHGAALSDADFLL